MPQFHALAASLRELCWLSLLSPSQCFQPTPPLALPTGCSLAIPRGPARIAREYNDKISEQVSGCRVKDISQLQFHIELVNTRI